MCSASSGCGTARRRSWSPTSPGWSWRGRSPVLRSGEQRPVPRERLEDAIDVLLHVVEVKRDPEVRVARRGDETLVRKRIDERVRIGRHDAHQWPVLAIAAPGRHRRPKLVKPGEEPVDEAPDVAFDRGHTRLRDQL